MLKGGLKLVCFIFLILATTFGLWTYFCFGRINMPYFLLTKDNLSDDIFSDFYNLLLILIGLSYVMYNPFFNFSLRQFI